MERDILLIDDDIDELVIFLDALGQLADESFTCSYACDAKQAMEMLHDHVPRFIFVDFNIPGINGLELLAEIRKQPRLEAVRVFLYSNYVDDKVSKKAKSMGASGCIRKTHTIRTLVSELKVILTSGPELAYTVFKGK